MLLGSRRTWRVLVMGLVLGLVAGACATEAGPDGGVAATTTTGPPSTTDSDDPADPDDPLGGATVGPGGFVPGPLEWERCGPAECAALDVPLDYDDLDGPTFEIGMARTPATGERVGALFLNPGGPGASAAELAGLAGFLLPDAITERFDLIGVDPRGVGASSPISCGIPAKELYGIDHTIDTPADAEALLEASQAYVDDCDRRFGDVLAHVGTRAVARDMDTVRAALGDDQLSYLGFSYGSVIGQVYAAEFPDRVRAMVLDGIVELGPTGIELATGQAAGFEVALSRFTAGCDGDPSCRAGPDSLATVEAVLALAEEGDGIPAPRADRPAGPGEAALGIAYPLYSTALWRQLGEALADAVEGDGSRLVGLADGYLGFGTFEVYFAVNCLDFEWPRDPEEILAGAKAAGEDSPRFGEALVNDYVRCALWPVEPDPLGPVTAPGTPPILVVSTTGDPATPYEAGAAVAERLASGVLLTYEGDGHTVVLDGEPCIEAIVERYLVDLEPPAHGTVC